MKNRAILMLAAALFVASLSGCGSLFIRTTGKESFGKPLYRGAFADLGLIVLTQDEHRSETPGAVIAFRAAGIIDLPFSLILDTILIPIDLLVSAFEAEPRESHRDQRRSINASAMMDFSGQQQKSQASKELGILGLSAFSPRQL